MTSTIDKGLSAPPAGPDDVEELERREKQFRLSGNPYALWPETDPRALQGAADAVERAARELLAGQTSRIESGSQFAARDLGIAALLSGAGPLLGYWIERGDLRASEDVHQVLAQHLSESRTRVIRARQMVLPVLAQLADEGVAPAVIKGFHTAHVFFPEPGTRPFGDVDVVVRPDEIATTERALLASGFRQGRGRDNPYKRDWYAPGDDGRVWSFEMWHSRNRCKVELHAGLILDALADRAVRLEDHATFAGSLELDGVPFRTPAPPLLLVMLATHLSTELFASRLLRTVELIFVIRREQALGRLDWAAVEELLARSGTTRFVLPAFSLLDQLSPGVIPNALLRRVTSASTRLARRVAARMTPTHPLVNYPISLSERFMWELDARGVATQIVRMLRPPSRADGVTAMQLYRSRFLRLVGARIPRTHAPSGRAPRDT